MKHSLNLLGATLLASALACGLAGCAQDTPAASPDASSSTGASEVPDSSASQGAGDSSASGTPGAASPSPALATPTVPTEIGGFDYSREPAASEQRMTVHLSVAEVRSTSTGTRVTFWLKGPSEVSSPPMDSYQPERFPQLTDPASHTVYRVDTWPDESRTSCVCSDTWGLFPKNIHPMDASYPPLPDGVSQVVVSIPGAKGQVTVPVTR